jgi:putative DNA primase/helicase
LRGPAGSTLYQIADAWPEVPKSRRTIQHCFEAGHGHPRRRPERPQITNQQARQQETAPSVDETIEAADSVAATDRPIFAARNPFMLARAFIDQHYTTDGKRTLHYWNESFLEWTGSYYSEISDGEIKSAVGNFLDKEVTLINKDGDPVAPTTWHTTNVVAMLGHEVRLSSKSIKPPIWLGENPGYPTEHLIALRNGLFDLTTAALDDPDPRFFNLNGIAASYDGTAECPNWLKFLAEVFPDDQESIDCLQEMFGYLLEVDNSLQKIFVLIGEKRSGKGTIKKVLDVLLGSAAISTSLTDLGGAFGLEPLIGHSVAIVPDARLGTHADPNAIVERLLTISGADNPSVPRKNKTNFKGPFAPRFVLLMNQWIPVLDTSGALATRLIPLRFLVSFEGREDKDLFVRDLAPEIDGIFRWAWRGWMNLYHRGDNQPPHFMVPDTASGLLASIVEQTNPLFDFLDDEGVEFGPRFWCFKKGVDGLNERYEGWADAKKKRHPMTYARFYALLNAVPGVNTEWRYDEETKKVRDRNGKPADRRVLGLRLKGSNNEI